MWIMTDTQYLLSIDPGLSTGIVLGKYHVDETFQVLDKWQVPGGLTGFKAWLHSEAMYDRTINLMSFKMREDRYKTDFLVFDPEAPEHYTVICERFVPLSGGGFSHTSDSVEPLRIEGALRAHGLMPDDYGDPRWQRPSAMVLHKVGNTAENKKASDSVLRHMGLWHTGKQVGMKDANDVNSSVKHSIAYLKKMKHAPTLEAIKGATACPTR